MKITVIHKRSLFITTNLLLKKSCNEQIAKATRPL